MITQKILGPVEYLGQVGTAIREIYRDCWKFVIVIDGERHVIIEY